MEKLTEISGILFLCVMAIVAILIINSKHTEKIQAYLQHGGLTSTAVFATLLFIFKGAVAEPVLITLLISLFASLIAFLLGCMVMLFNFPKVLAIAAGNYIKKDLETRLKPMERKRWLRDLDNMQAIEMYTGFKSVRQDALERKYEKFLAIQRAMKKVQPTMR